MFIQTPEQQNDRKFDALGVPENCIGRATYAKKSASLAVIHIPSEETAARAFVATNNVIFCHEYPLAPINSAQDSGGVIDSIYLLLQQI